LEDINSSTIFAKLTTSMIIACGIPKITIFNFECDPSWKVTL
jgi:hypothetical protein